MPRFVFIQKLSNTNLFTFFAKRPDEESDEVNLFCLGHLEENGDVKDGLRVSCIKARVSKAITLEIWVM